MKTTANTVLAMCATLFIGATIMAQDPWALREWLILFYLNGVLLVMINK